MLNCRHDPFPRLDANTSKRPLSVNRSTRLRSLLVLTFSHSLKLSELIFSVCNDPEEWHFSKIIFINSDSFPERPSTVHFAVDLLSNCCLIAVLSAVQSGVLLLSNEFSRRTSLLSNCCRSAV